MEKKETFSVSFYTFYVSPAVFEIIKYNRTVTVTHTFPYLFLVMLDISVKPKYSNCSKSPLNTTMAHIGYVLELIAL
jgi:hypothetical protein